MVKYFLKEMNNNAKKLKMFTTNYDSPHGLMNKYNYSSAHDVVLLIEYCMKMEEFRAVVNTKNFECHAVKSNRPKLTRYRWENTNKLLGNYDGIIGCKTGITNAAGPCFAGYYEKDDE